jgi:hypothetical protein
VSSLHSAALKRVLSHRVHVAAEVASQWMPALTFFDPGMFLLLHKD